MKTASFTMTNHELSHYQPRGKDLAAHYARAKDANTQPTPRPAGLPRIDPRSFDAFLHLAADDGNLGRVKAAVLNQHFDVNLLDYDGATPLHRAARGAHDASPSDADYLGVVLFLLENGASVGASKALELAIFFGQAEIAKVLLGHGVTIASPDRANAVFYASRHDGALLPIVRPLASAEDLSRALEQAVHLKRDKQIDSLLEAGAKPTHSTIGEAARQGDTNLIKLLASRID